MADREAPTSSPNGSHGASPPAVRPPWHDLWLGLRSPGARRFAAFAVALALVFTAVRYLVTPEPRAYKDPVEQFKYGSIAGEHVFGIPIELWHTLPELFADRLPGPGGYASFGMVFEPGHDTPAGTSVRRVMGFDRVWLNCAICHTGTVRATPDATPTVIAGMPANTFDFGAFTQFFLEAAPDKRFTPERLLNRITYRAEHGHPGTSYDALDFFLMRFIGVPLFRQQTLMVRDRLKIFRDQPAWGPGRVDTFNAAKVLFGFPTDALPERERIGTADFPSIWNQRSREGMQLHWDGNNTSLSERNRSAALGAGVTPSTHQPKLLERVATWLETAQPPPYPYPIDAAKAARGAPIYARLCADCHGASGTDFTGRFVGKVVDIADIGTDRHRLDSYTRELNANQNTLYVGDERYRFQHFRKTNGYANMPLDGLWLRAPYLHNGSVPTMRALLDPPAMRPTIFYRGNDVYDPVRLGFEATVPAYPHLDPPRTFFRFDVTVAGNGNEGHTGEAYGTDLPDADKDALVEYLKTF